MLPRTSTEEELMPMFLPFGEIIEFTILKGPDRTSKGNILFNFHCGNIHQAVPSCVIRTSAVLQLP